MSGAAHPSIGIGFRVGKLTVQAPTEQRKNGYTVWDNRGEKVFEQRYPRFTSFQFRPWTLRCVTEEMRKVGVDDRL